MQHYTLLRPTHSQWFARRNEGTVTCYSKQSIHLAPNCARLCQHISASARHSIHRRPRQTSPSPAAQNTHTATSTWTQQPSASQRNRPLPQLPPTRHLEPKKKGANQHPSTRPAPPPHRPGLGTHGLRRRAQRSTWYTGSLSATVGSTRHGDVTSAA